jgi:hypothetical protein
MVAMSGVATIAESDAMSLREFNLVIETLNVINQEKPEGLPAGVAGYGRMG